MLQESDDDDVEEEVLMPIKGPLPPTLGKWASCIRLINPKTATTLECLELANNDAGFSVTPVVFNSRGGEVFIAIGIVRSLLLHPRSHSGCSVSIYRVLDNRLVLLHTTDIPDVPLAMVEFQVHYIHTLCFR
jgi:splicing factor 3B subunit 3